MVNSRRILKERICDGFCFFFISRSIMTKISPKYILSDDSEICTQFDFDSNRLRLERSQVLYDTNEINFCAEQNLISSKY